MKTSFSCSFRRESYRQNHVCELWPLQKSYESSEDEKVNLSYFFYRLENCLSCSFRESYKQSYELWRPKQSHASSEDEINEFFSIRIVVMHNIFFINNIYLKNVSYAGYCCGLLSVGNKKRPDGQWQYCRLLLIFDKKFESLCHAILIWPDHRLNMELDLQSLFGLHVTWCTQLLSLAETPSPPLLPHLDS